MKESKKPIGLDLDAIVRRAKAARPGPWTADGEEIRDADGDDIAEVMGSGTSTVADLANAAHIAGMDPPTTIALVDRLREAERRLSHSNEPDKLPHQDECSK